MKKLFPLALLFIFLATSCNKEKRTIKKLEGKWTVTREVDYNSDGSTEDYTLSQNEQYVLDFTQNQSPLANNFNVLWMDGLECFYDLNDDATHFTLAEDPTDPSDFINVEIKTLKKKELVIRADEGDGDYSELHMKKD